jgi:hypothetical protein
MPLTCNIDKRGRKVRLVIGVILDCLGCLMIVGGILTSEAILLGAGVAACLGGSFMIFEGAAGWCAIRAMGFKTRL